MDDKVVTLIIGLAGIVATLISSGLGLYFVVKARSAPLRELLFNKQLDFITRIIHKQGRFRIFANILAGPEEDYKNLARNDIGICLRDFSELTEESAAILPVELWIEISQLSRQMTDVLVEYDDANKISEEKMRELAARSTKVALISRAVMGADELTEENIKLFSSKEEFENLAKIELEYFKKLHDKSTLTP